MTYSESTELIFVNLCFFRNPVKPCQKNLFIAIVSFLKDIRK
ncbi:MAG: hypothetical protein WAO52_04445 [Prolixibacteraceae bacterium]